MPWQLFATVMLQFIIACVVVFICSAILAGIVKGMRNQK